MGTIKVQVVTIDDIKPHPNANTLELATIGGWQMCVKKGAHEQGTVLPREVAEAFGVDRYLAEKTDIHGLRVLVVHRVQLRGEPSFGLVMAPEPGMSLGMDVADYFSAYKFQPPVRITAGDATSDDPRFPTYTDIENLRSYPTLFQPEETVVATEKIHGTNCRVGFVVDEGQLVPLAGSRRMRRREPEKVAAADTTDL
ncbi:MAG: hypothetical protein ACFCBW_07850 [Candidatus Competibacterales bacterium]